MFNLGPVSYYLGIAIIRDRQNRTIRLSQEAYIKRIVRDYSQ